ncbi:lipid droplet-associated hydrolase isoform X2 [Brienomyrus brachyistius]|uniref:lipid droplet-associated hydrolase isoform X2 n=1 Tax=Brienomyrus brachyistius TaxID=42636 RepID=UPI0020B29AE6|nr:lipid droplet-associated hydrolase isoform X2 [Brienomyrus brachyistius]
MQRALWVSHLGQSVRSWPCSVPQKRRLSWPFTESRGARSRRTPIPAPEFVAHVIEMKAAMVMGRWWGCGSWAEMARKRREEEAVRRKCRRDGGEKMVGIRRPGRRWRRKGERRRKCRRDGDGPLLETHDVFGLRGQIEHKMAFLKRHVPRDTKLVLIGHSIGCYIILEMMKRDPQMQVLKALLLFPTIERMAASPQGRLMTPVLCRLRFITYLPIFLLSLLPLSLQAAIVKVVLSGLPSLDRTAAAATLSLFNVDCVGESTSGCPHPAPHTLPLYPRPSNPVPYAPHPTPYVLLSPLHSPILYLHPTLYPTPSHPVPYTLPSTLHTVK